MNLKQWKLKDGRTYEQITNDLGGVRSPQWIALVINGKRKPGTPLLIGLRTLTGLSCDEILRTDEKK